MVIIHNTIQAVAFDLDNTLVSSSLNFTQIKEAIGCARDMDILSYSESLPEKEQKIVNQILNEYESADANKAYKLPGAEQVLNLIESLNMPCGIITRNNAHAAAIKIDRNNIAVSTVITREDFKAKPAPDALIYLSKSWQVPAENILYVGDYLYDIQMAINAKALSCLLTYNQPVEYANLANYVVNDLLELVTIIQQNVEK